VYVARTEDRASFVEWVLEKVQADFGKSQRMKVLVKPNIVGLVFSLLIQLALLEETVERALEVLISKPRLSGHNYYIVGADGKAYDVEVTAHHHAVEELTEGIFVHANHYHAQELRKSAIDYSPTSEMREASLRAYLEGRWPHPQISDFKVALSIHEGGICRHEEKNSTVCTCGALIFDPANLTTCINQGYPCLSNWQEYSIE